MTHILRITGVGRAKKGFVDIYADDELVCSLRSDIFSSSGLREGAEITADELDEIKLESDIKTAHDKALRLLSARSYSSGGLRRKLEPLAGSEAAESAINRMTELGLLDDWDYARRYASDCVKLKGFSPSRTRLALIEKGIPRDIAEDVASNLDVDKAEAVKELILKKYIRYLDDEKGVRKTVNALLRRGHSYSDIRDALESLRPDVETDGEYSERT